MQRFTCLFVASFVILLLLTQNSFAVGLGGFIDASGGSGKAEGESDYESWDIDSNAFAFGFVLDTAPTNEKTFNYRLNVGFAKQDIKNENNDKLRSNGIYIENIFGFAFIKNENFRWWGGPLIRLGYYSGDADSYRVGSTIYEAKFDYAEVGVGAVTGLNFKAGKAILAPSIGFRVNGFGGEETITEKTSYGNSSYTEDITGNSTNIFANFAVLF